MQAMSLRLCAEKDVAEQFAKQTTILIFDGIKYASMISFHL